MIKVKMGAIVKEVSKAALKWYVNAGLKVLSTKKENKKDEANTEKVITA